MDPKVKMIAGGVMGVFALAAAASSCTQVNQSEVGIDYSFGKMTANESSDLRGPGLSFKAPWVSVRKIDVTKQFYNLDDVSIYTKDNQEIIAKIAIVYQVPANSVVSIYKDNPNYQTGLEKTILDSVKKTFGNYQAESIADNRTEIMTAVTTDTKQRLAALYGIDVIDVQLPNFDFNPEYAAKVKEAANAKAELSKKATELETARRQSEITITQAEAASESAKRTADGAAYSTKVAKQAEADGILSVALAEAEGFQKVQEAVGRENMGTYLTTGKWDGKLPTVQSGGGATPAVVVPIPAPGR